MSLNSATSGLMVKVFPIKILGRKKLLFQSVENSPGYILKKCFFNIAVIDSEHFKFQQMQSEGLIAVCCCGR